MDYTTRSPVSPYGPTYPSQRPFSPYTSRYPRSSSFSSNPATSRRRDSNADYGYPPYTSSAQAGPSTPRKSPVAPRAPRRSDSDAEDGEIDEWDTLPQPSPPRMHDDFSAERVSAWYQGRDPYEPARPGVLDSSSKFGESGSL